MITKNVKIHLFFHYDENNSYLLFRQFVFEKNIKENKRI